MKVGKPVEQYQQPVRRPADRANILLKRQPCELINLLLPISEERQNSRWKGIGPQPPGNLIGFNAAQVARIDPRRFLPQVGAAAQDEGHCHVNRKFAGQMTMAATVHAATVAWRHVSIA